MYREAWERGLKTTYYLRTLNKSGIDNANRERRAPELTKRDITDAEKVAMFPRGRAKRRAMRRMSVSSH